MPPLAKRLAATFLISAAGIAAIVADEGQRNTAYLDIANIPTICVGHTAGVRLGQTANDEVCRELLKQDVRVAEAAVRSAVKVKITQGQYDALVSWTFNVGADAAGGSTLMRKLNAGDCRGAAAEFSRWDKARVNGKLRSVRGLTVRRAGERTRFEKDC